MVDRQTNRQTETHLMASFQDNLGKPAPERLTNLDFNKATDDWVAVASAGPCAQITTPDKSSTPAPHHSIFCRMDALPDAKPTASISNGAVLIFEVSIGFPVFLKVSSICGIAISKYCDIGIGVQYFSTFALF